jgi:hypothetical protein
MIKKGVLLITYAIKLLISLLFVGVVLLLVNCGGTTSPTPQYYPTSGPTGPQGTSGVNGTNGNGVTMVQFCPNVTTMYPSTFPEFGFCVGGILYATYWNGTNAWTAEIVPGVYMSTSTSAPCNFTVVTNCGIIN